MAKKPTPKKRKAARGRSALTDKQWADIEKRLLAGEACRALAREYGISDTAIRKRMGLQTKAERRIAHQMVAAEQEFSALPISSQIRVANLMDELRAVSVHLAGSAKLGAMTAHRLSGIANQQVDRLNDADPIDGESLETLRGIAAYTEVANKAAQVGINLLAANKEAIHAGNVDVGALSDDELRKLAKG